MQNVGGYRTGTPQSPSLAGARLASYLAYPQSAHILGEPQPARPPVASPLCGFVVGIPLRAGGK